MKHFVRNAGEQLYLGSETSQAKAIVSHSRSDVYERRPESLRKGVELLWLEIGEYVINVYLRKSELVENFTSYTTCRRHYYSKSEYYSIFEGMELMEELNSKDATVDDHYLVLTRFLACGTESTVLMGMDYELVVLEAFLREYVEEVDSPGDDWYTTLTDFLDIHTYDDTEEARNGLDRKQMSYRRFKRKRDQ